MQYAAATFALLQNVVLAAFATTNISVHVPAAMCADAINAAAVVAAASKPPAAGAASSIVFAVHFVAAVVVFLADSVHNVVVDTAASRSDID